MTDGPSSVSTLILVVVRSNELLLPEKDKLVGLDVHVTEGDNDCGDIIEGDDDNEAPS
jgi:hypothetical protein